MYNSVKFGNSLKIKHAIKYDKIICSSNMTFQIRLQNTVKHLLDLMRYKYCRLLKEQFIQK